MSVTAAAGFVASGIGCGIKASGAPDLAMVATDDHTPVAAAGVFTTNLAQAAPVQISQRHLADGAFAPRQLGLSPVLIGWLSRRQNNKVDSVHFTD